jgi:hypothetical protein
VIEVILHRAARQVGIHASSVVTVGFVAHYSIRYQPEFRPRLSVLVYQPLRLGLGSMFRGLCVLIAIGGLIVVALYLGGNYLRRSV